MAKIIWSNLFVGAILWSLVIFYGTPLYFQLLIAQLIVNVVGAITTRILDRRDLAKGFLLSVVLLLLLGPTVCTLALFTPL